MQEIEARGGFRKAQVEGMIARTLERSLAAREQAVASRRRVLVGTNQFANPAERALGRVDEQRMQADLRGARPYEELRLRTERHAAAGGKTPRVLLAEIGDVEDARGAGEFCGEFLCLRGI